MGKLEDCRVGTMKAQDEPGTSCGSKKRERAKKILGTCQKPTRPA